MNNESLKPGRSWKVDIPKPWWPGDSRVERYMHPVREALERQGITGQAHTDLYNRAYYAVYQAIIDREGKYPCL